MLEILQFREDSRQDKINFYLYISTNYACCICTDSRYSSLKKFHKCQLKPSGFCLSISCFLRLDIGKLVYLLCFRPKLHIFFESLWYIILAWLTGCIGKFGVGDLEKSIKLMFKYSFLYPLLKLSST